MSSGENAADGVKNILNQGAGEELRKNVNSFADDSLGGNKTHDSTGIHPDAKKTGSEMEKGVESAGKKIDEMMHKHK